MMSEWTAGNVFDLFKAGIDWNEDGIIALARKHPRWEKGPLGKTSFS